MVGFLYPFTVEEDLNNQQSKFKSSDNPVEFKNSDNPVDFSVPELDSFADSFLDLDAIKNWIDEIPDPYLMESKPDLETVDSVKAEFGVVQKDIEEVRDVSCVENTVGDTLGDAFEALGNFSSSIEEEMGKVRLEGACNGSVVACENGGNSSEMGYDCGSGAKNFDLFCVDDSHMKAGKVLGTDEDGMRYGEMFSVNEGESNGCEREDGEGEGEGMRDGEMFSVNEGESNGCEREDGDGDGDGDGEGEGDSSSDSESGSSSSSSSSSCSSSSDDDDEDDVEENPEDNSEGENDKKERNGEADVEEGEIKDSDGEEMVVCDVEEDDEDGGTVAKGPIRSKNEIKVLPPVLPVTVTLQSFHQILPVGVVLSVIGSQVIVEGLEEHNPLNEGSVLWITGSRSPLGLVDEIFGPVKNPYYVVRYNSENEVPAGIQQGTSISYVPEFVNHVLNEKDLYKKGYDASGENDEEVSDEAEFSDDEKETEYRRTVKMAKRGTNDQKPGNMKKGRKNRNCGRTWKNGQLSTSEGLADVWQQQSQPNEHVIQPVAVPVDNGNQSHTFGQVQGFAGGLVCVPPPLQITQPFGFGTPPNSVWTNVMQNQQQHSMAFRNGFPTNNMPWVQQNFSQQSYQLALQNRMPFQQQLNPGPGLPSNAVLPHQQSKFSAGPTFVPWPPCPIEGGFNQIPFGMGLQNQLAPVPSNVGEPEVAPVRFPQQLNCDLQQPSAKPHNIEAPKKFGQGACFGHGRKEYRGRGGRIRGGRGHQSR